MDRRLLSRRKAGAPDRRALGRRDVEDGSEPCARRRRRAVRSPGPFGRCVGVRRRIPGGSAPSQPFAERRSGGAWFADPTPALPVAASFTGLDAVNATDVVAVGYEQSADLL